MTLTFDYLDVKSRYNYFVNDFLSCEANVQKTQLLPNVWAVCVPDKDFKVMITLESIRSPYGFEEWLAVVKEPVGEKTNYLLFQDEIENWLAEQRRLRGIVL
ncbi:hypothetical protein [Neobacillus drentensis]|uniref:hypothetical protein n=1 Tax=Neobacillus drentensis TaxID=220684 RepID=UPI002FFF41F3